MKFEILPYDFLIVLLNNRSPGKKWLNLEEIANKAILVSLEPQSYVEY